MVANIEIRGVDSQSCHFIWGLMLGYYDVEDTWPQFNRTKQACAPHARARSLTLLYCFQKGIELSISFIVYTLTDFYSALIQRIRLYSVDTQGPTWLRKSGGAIT